MTVKVITDQEIVEEATDVLLEHLGPAKMARFWAAWQVGTGDYIALRGMVQKPGELD